MLEKLIVKYQTASNAMLGSIKNDDLSNNDKIEWYGYMRGVRDCAYDAGILNKTTIQENLEEAVRLVF